MKAEIRNVNSLQFAFELLFCRDLGKYKIQSVGMMGHLYSSISVCHRDLSKDKKIKITSLSDSGV